MDNSEMPIYDLSQLQQMSRGNDAFVTKMIDIFIKLTEENTANFKNALANDDFETIKKLAHKIKPSIDQLGITSLREVVREVEKYDVATEPKEELERKVNKIVSVLREVAAKLA